MEIERRLTATLRKAAEEELEPLHHRAARHVQKSLDDHERGLTLGIATRWTIEQLLG